MTSLNQWIVEYEKISLIHHLEKLIAYATSPYQEIAVADTKGYGRALFLDGVAQSSAFDEHIYHEALVHPAMVAHSNPHRILIAGGGEGATLREILKHNTVEKVVMVDLDEVLVRLAHEHLSDWHQSSFHDPRVEVRYEDIKQYLTQAKPFDVIIADLPDPLEGDHPVADLYTTQFFESIRTRLEKPGGIFITQSGTTDLGDHLPYLNIVERLRQTFSYVYPYQVAIPFYRSMWGFIAASNHPLTERWTHINSILQARDCLDLRFYDQESHQHMISLPKYLRL